MLEQKRERHAKSALDSHKQLIEERINHPQSQKAIVENKVFVEEIHGLQGGVITKKLGFPGLFQPDQYRFADRVDYIPQGVVENSYNKAHNLSQLEAFSEEQLFENIYGEDDHFEKFLDFEEKEFVASLMHNQILLTNLVPKITL